MNDIALAKAETLLEERSVQQSQNILNADVVNSIGFMNLPEDIQFALLHLLKATEEEIMVTHSGRDKETVVSIGKVNSIFASPAPGGFNISGELGYLPFINLKDIKSLTIGASTPRLEDL